MRNIDAQFLTGDFMRSDDTMWKRLPKGKMSLDEFAKLRALELIRLEDGRLWRKCKYHVEIDRWIFAID